MTESPIPGHEAGQTAALGEALAALNAASVTPSAAEVLAPYAQAFRSTPEAEAVIAALAGQARLGRVVGYSQEQLARLAGVSASTVSEVIDRLRRLDLLTTTGGEYLPGRRRRRLLRYRLRWSPVMDLSAERLKQAASCGAALAAGATPQRARRLARAPEPDSL